MSNDARLDVLIAEYNQLYENTRHDDRIAANKESVFIGISYGILAYTAGLSLTNTQEYGAAIASITVYLWHVFAIERMSFYYEARFEKIREIENIMKNVSNLQYFTFQEDYKNMYQNVREKRREIRSVFSYVNPYNWVVVLSENIGIRPVRMSMSVILLVLWWFRIQL